MGKDLEMLFLFFLVACNPSPYDAADTAEIFCTDERGYDHEVGTWWQCVDSCFTCSCDDGGEIIISDDGPVIVTQDCRQQ
jgi:hypothetical protein